MAEAGLDDRFQIIRLLGRGGMGVVYEAFDKHLGRQVAIKIMDTCGDDEFRQRFEREGAVMASLQHQGICRFHHFGLSPDQKPYISMELIHGQSLRCIIDEEESLDAQRVLQWFVQLCAALDYAHRQSVIHRDIKPANIMIATLDTTEIPIILDFGLSKFVDRGNLTKTGDMLGTPHYCSPEQSCGHRPADGRADQYSLACVLYECLTGERPFEASDLVAMLHKHMHDRPPILLPSKERGIDEPFCEAMNRILFKSLAKEPNDRYKTMGELGNDLAAVQNARFGEVLAPALEAARKSTNWFMRTVVVFIILMVSLTFIGKDQVLAAAARQYTEFDRSEAAVGKVRTWSRELALAGLPSAGSAILNKCLECSQSRKEPLERALICADLTEPVYSLPTSETFRYAEWALHLVGESTRAPVKPDSNQQARIVEVIHRLTNATKSGRLMVNLEMISDCGAVLRFADPVTLQTMVTFLGELRSSYRYTNGVSAKLDEAIATGWQSLGNNAEALAYQTEALKYYPTVQIDSSEVIACEFKVGVLKRLTGDIAKDKQIQTRLLSAIVKYNRPDVQEMILNELLCCAEAERDKQAVDHYSRLLAAVAPVKMLLQQAQDFYRDNRLIQARHVVRAIREATAVEAVNKPLFLTILDLLIRDPDFASVTDELGKWFHRCDKLQFSPPERAWIQNWKAYWLLKNGHYSETELICESALKEQQWDKQSATVLQASLNRSWGEALQARGRNADALDRLQICLNALKQDRSVTPATIHQIEDEINGLRVLIGEHAASTSGK